MNILATKIPRHDGNRFDSNTITVKLAQRYFSFSSTILLCAIIVISVSLRIGSAVYQGNEVTDLPGIYDQISYDGLARRVIEGYGFSFAEGHWPATRAGEPTAHWSFLYTLFLAAVYKLFGTYPIIARIIQAIIVGILQPWFTFRIAKQLFGTVIGIAAAFISAIYIYFFYYAGGLITESFYLLGILWVLYIVLHINRTTIQKQQPVPILSWILLGLALGMTILLRQVFLIFLPFLLLWIYIGSLRKHRISFTLRKWKLWVNWSFIRGLGITILIVVLFIAPWTIRNYNAFDTFVLLNTNAGYAFYWGNHPIYGDRYVPILPDDSPGYYNLIPKEFLYLNEAKLDNALLSLGIGFVVNDPVRFIFLSLGRVIEYIKFWPTPESGLVSNISRVGSFGLFLPFMIYGSWNSLRIISKTKSIFLQNGVVLLLLFVLIYSGIHFLSWSLVRYRIPVDSVLITFAGMGLVRALRWLRLDIS